jgi:glutamate-1-semialdehyde 2,1-aminomutase
MSGEIHFSHQPPLDAAGPTERPRAVRSAGGIPEVLGDTLIVQPWNEPDILEQTVAEHKDEIAAIITEPVMGNCGVIPPRAGYLEFLRDITQQNGIVLIFDEVKTGFRLAFGGAQEYFGVTPDLSVFYWWRFPSRGDDWRQRRCDGGVRCGACLAVWHLHGQPGVFGRHAGRL